MPPTGLVFPAFPPNHNPTMHDVKTTAGAEGPISGATIKPTFSRSRHRRTFQRRLRRPPNLLVSLTWLRPSACLIRSVFNLTTFSQSPLQRSRHQRPGSCFVRHCSGAVMAGYVRGDLSEHPFLEADLALTGRRPAAPRVAFPVSTWCPLVRLNGASADVPCRSCRFSMLRKSPYQAR